MTLAEKLKFIEQVEAENDRKIAEFYDKQESAERIFYRSESRYTALARQRKAEAFKMGLKKGIGIVGEFVSLTLAMVAMLVLIPVFMCIIGG